MEKKKSKKRRKKPPGKGGRATVPPRAISEVVSGIVRTLADKKFGDKLADKDSPPRRRKQM
jgi:hypothetical protein